MPVNRDELDQLTPRRRRMTPKKSMKPTRKVASGGAWGAATVVGVFVAGQFGVDVPPEVASAATVAVSTFAAWVTESYGTG